MAPLPAAALLAAALAAPDAKPWAFRPIVRPPVPAGAAHPVDAFVRAKLRAAGLTPAPPADPRTLIRRLTFDLTGLPPTPEEVDAFVQSAIRNPRSAMEQAVDRLLASPRYGERWARHWLDVARYADTHGHDQDRLRPNAWPYRDSVIRALNADVPYARFVREQIAGDVLFPRDPRAIEATGFLAAGPWDESGLRDINEKSPDREAARYADRDEIVTAVMGAFAGLTVGCARCHDHKFDPVPQDDYYALQAVFAGTDKAEREYDADPAVARRRETLANELAAARAGADDPPAPEHQADADAYELSWRAADASWRTPAVAAVHSSHGSKLRALADGSVLAVGAAPERDTYTLTVAATAPVTALRLELLADDSLPHNGPGRCANGNLHLSELRVSAAPAGRPADRRPLRVAWAAADFDQDGWGVARAADGDPKTAWGIFPRVGEDHRAVFALAEPLRHPEDTVLTIELDQLHGGGHLLGRFHVGVTSAPTTDALKPVPNAVAGLLAAPPFVRSPAASAELARWVRERAVSARIASLPPAARVYCGTNRFAPDGSFRPAPAPRPVRVLRRGDLARPGDPAEPGAVAAVPGLDARFPLTAGMGEGDRRAALAEWLADKRNPLTWRVAVNRVWHHHFGRGIVDTPNDFGAMGGAPSHPELLDWLAAEFRDSGGSLKALHRLIVTSETYRRSSGLRNADFGLRMEKQPGAALAGVAASFNPQSEIRIPQWIDADNRLLWRANRARLDAESYRDAVLAVSGRLDLAMYGPPTPHFVSASGTHVTADPDYERFDVDAPAARRRSVYRLIFRTRPDPFLQALDCPDAAQPAPTRAESAGAPQALALWNNKFVLRHAEHLAGAARAAAPDPAGQARYLTRRVLGREPSAEEASAWGDFARAHGAANLARVLLNSSEFLYVD